MQVATGVLSPLLRKLSELLAAEFTLSSRVKKGIQSLTTELEMIHGDLGPNNLKNGVNKFFKRTKKLFSKGKALHQISGAIQDA
ncbi:hypothetical protein ZWY2020_000830 [Hordeum vulgare]|nr:hypothetical protein ZWY2020_000830 [Hordeum vulgare]